MRSGILNLLFGTAFLMVLSSAHGSFEICSLLPEHSLQKDACITIDTFLESYYGWTGGKGRELVPSRCLDTDDPKARRVCKSYLFLVNLYFNLGEYTGNFGNNPGVTSETDGEAKYNFYDNLRTSATATTSEK